MPASITLVSISVKNIVELLSSSFSLKINVPFPSALEGLTHIHPIRSLRDCCQCPAGGCHQTFRPGHHMFLNDCAVPVVIKTNGPRRGPSRPRGIHPRSLSLLSWALPWSLLGQNSTRPHVTIFVLRMLYGAPRLEKGAEGLWFQAWAWGSTLGMDSDAVTY